MKIDDYKEYYCLALTELILGRTCGNRKMKSNIAENNSKFAHHMDPFTLAACTKCAGGKEGLMVPGFDQELAV